MSQTDESLSTDAAEKAYEAAAAEAIAKAETATAPAPLAFPAKEERAAAPLTETPASAPAAKAAPLKAPAAAAKPSKTATAKTAKTAAAPKPASTAPAAIAAPVPTSTPAKSLKEKTMTAKSTTDFTKTIKSYAAEAQAKAKAAYAKGSEAVGEVSEFAKGNLEAVVASGKVLGAGLQDIGKTYAAEGKAAVETVTADVKKIAAVKSPVEFVQTQSEILRKNFDHAIDFNAKTSETMIKLLGDAFAPLSARANLALSKVRKAA